LANLVAQRKVKTKSPIPAMLRKATQAIEPAPGLCDVILKELGTFACPAARETTLLNLTFNRQALRIAKP
jgi:hypothetical protein